MNTFWHRSLKPLARPLLLLTLFSLPCAAQAQAQAETGQPFAAMGLAPKDQKALGDARALANNEKLLRQSLAWEEAEASLNDIAEHAQELLGAGAPRIEVRGATTVRSTFALEKAAVGATLVSLARLANSRLWVFADHLVIAPESALTEAEAATVKRLEGGDWAKSPTITGISPGWNAVDMENRIALRIVGTDMKARLTAKGQTEPLPRPEFTTPPHPATLRDNPFAPFKLPFGELSLPTQKLLQAMLDAQVQQFRGATAKDNRASRLGPEVIVGFDDTNPMQMRLFVQGTTLPQFVTQWYVNN